MTSRLTLVLHLLSLTDCVMGVLLLPLTTSAMGVLFSRSASFCSSFSQASFSMRASMCLFSASVSTTSADTATFQLGCEISCEGYHIDLHTRAGHCNNSRLNRLGRKATDSAHSHPEGHTSVEVKIFPMKARKLPQNKQRNAIEILMSDNDTYQGLSHYHVYVERMHRTMYM